MSFLKADYEIRDPSLAAQGEELLNTVRQKMPVLELISMRFQKTAIFKGMKILLCLHATRETAILAMALKAGGADVYMVGCNVNTINDPVMATLAVNHGVHVFADSTKNSEENRAYMDLSFSIQAMAIEYLVESKGKIPNKLQCVPDEVDQSISRLKLRTYGITIDSMTQEQKKYAARFIHLTK